MFNTIQQQDDTRAIANFGNLDIQNVQSKNQFHQKEYSKKRKKRKHKLNKSVVPLDQLPVQKVTKGQIERENSNADSYFESYVN